MADRKPGLTSIIIPTYQHGAVIAEAVQCALWQTALCEVIVVDDGSTDDTLAVLARLVDHCPDSLRVIALPHGGPSVARNAGLDAAVGEFVMFLDADDLIEPTKVARQLEQFTPEVGWVLCDVRIDDEVRGRVRLASEQYGYAGKNLGGWIQDRLKAGNFIPIMSPLVRASVLESVRFRDELVPEDWHFWFAVAGLARVRYLPEVLATYRHGRTGRSRLPKTARAVSPNLTAPLRLNLGCGTQGTRSWHPMDGMVNLDKSMGWRYEDGLGDFIDRSVHGITISHSLMYVPLKKWPDVFSEFARVLAPGGVIRITEDDATNPASSRLGGWKGSDPAVTLTDARMMKAALEGAGLKAFDVDEKTTHYRDGSLRQAQHGAPPDVFFVEGVKVSGVLFSPHNDDETLFAAFTLLRHRPHVVVCFESTGDYGDAKVREAETLDAAVNVLGAAGVTQWSARGVADLVERMVAMDRETTPARVWAPDPQASHPDHIAVATAAAKVFGSRLTTYHTYDQSGKVRIGTAVRHEPGWTQQKLRALARYDSQIRHPRANQFFMDDLREWYGTERT